MKAAIVVPTIREDCIKRFVDTWDFSGHRLIVVEDNPEKTFQLPHWVEHYSWDTIEDDLGADAWIIPRRSGAIRNYGILEAAVGNPDMIVLLDDDCLPSEGNFLTQHWLALEAHGMDIPIFNTMHAASINGILPRGFPKESKKIRTVLNHGLWNNIPDLDGDTQLRHPGVRTQFPSQTMQIPLGTMFPLSAMNVAFRPELAPAMYQLPMGDGQPFHRFDDIWCGWIMKKACDTMGWSVRSGSPCIEHTRASDPKRNAEMEAPGILENERVWRAVLDTDPPSISLDACLENIHARLRHLGPYWENAAQAAAVWRSLLRQP